MLKFITIAFFISLAFFLIVGRLYLIQQQKYSSRLETQNVNTTIPTPQTLTLTGRVEFGRDLDPPRDYCPGEMYLVSTEGQSFIDGNKVLQLRPSDDSPLSGGQLYATFSGQVVSIKIKYQNLQNCPGETDLKCTCDPYVIADGEPSVVGKNNY